MAIGYEQWHEGTPYDLDALDALSDDEKREIEEQLVTRAGADWRDVQALDRLGTPRALCALERTLVTKELEIRVEAAACLARRGLLAGERLDQLIVDSLAHATISNGMVKTLAFAQERLTLPVLRQLFECAEKGNDDIRLHAAALIHYLFGVSKTAFDWDRRPFYLRFVSKDRKERRKAFIQLCRDVGADPEHLETLTLPRRRRRASLE
jgi:hypothetical protein